MLWVRPAKGGSRNRLKRMRLLFVLDLGVSWCPAPDTGLTLTKTDTSLLLRRAVRMPVCVERAGGGGRQKTEKDGVETA